MTSSPGRYARRVLQDLANRRQRRGRRVAYTTDLMPLEDRSVAGSLLTAPLGGGAPEPSPDRNRSIELSIVPGAGS
jgi:hypothetical protein